MSVRIRVNEQAMHPGAEPLVGRTALADQLFGHAPAAPAKVEDTDEHQRALGRHLFVVDVVQAARPSREPPVGRDLLAARLFGGMVAIKDLGEVAAVERWSAAEVERVQAMIAGLAPYSGDYPRIGVSGEGGTANQLVGEPESFWARIFGNNGGPAGGGNRPGGLRAA